MGVHGLWRLIEPSGQPIPLETLENKVLAVDISIWLHQAVKGFQDSKGAPVPNAHLLGIYHRVCKLLYFRIKPIFVFDGGVPSLKKQTIAKRTQSKLRNVAEADRIHRQLLSTLLKHTAVSKVLTEKIEASIGTISKASTKQSKDNLYILPATGELDSTFSSSEDESQSENTTDSSPTKNWDLHTIDMDSVQFKSLPVDVRHEILTDLKETRKQSSWGRLHELPKVSDDFSVYQLSRLRKRQAVQAALEDAEKEIGGKSLSLAELESILKDQGVINNQNVGTRIASDETTKYLLVKDLKKAMEEAQKNELNSENKIIEAKNDNPEIIVIEEDKKPVKTMADIEYEDDLQKAIALSLECEPSTSKISAIPEGPSTSSQPTKLTTNSAASSFLDNFADADFASGSSDEEPLVPKITESKISSAESYMLEYSGLTPNEIAKIMNKKSAVSDRKKCKSKKEVIPVICENKRKILESKLVADIKQIRLDGQESIKELKEDHENVELMSSTDSSDSEIEKKIVSTQGLDIVINPNQHFEDDLFSDIFQDHGKPISETETDSKALSDIPQKAINIVINRNEKINKNNDIFNDIFSKKDVGGMVPLDSSEIGIVKNNKKSLEIVHPTEQFIKDNDLFSDVFVEEKKMLGLDIQKTAVSCDIKISGDTVVESKENKINKNTIEDLNTNNETTQTEKLTKSGKTEVSFSDNLDINKMKTRKKESMTEQELLKLKNELQREKIDLLNEKSSKERIAGNITDQMYQEAQELLELFGVPYIIAPMEAEAQCAFLDEIELTDGTITDDSDIWLFGGRTVYKNFFNQSKYVMEFRADNIKHHFKLTREQMILLALLVGSDYTSGLQGIGPVTAVEILAAFPPSKGNINEFSLSHADLLSGLKEFRSWFLKGKSAGPGRNALKSKLKNLTFTENFPSLQVVEAYLDPKVETSREAFSWSKPNILALIEFAREKFGWTKNKSEDILNPVIKRLEESRHQKSIRDYFKTRFKVPSGVSESKMSKRVKSAVTNMGRDPSEIIAEELEEELKKEPRKKRPSKKKKDNIGAPEFSTNIANSKTGHQIVDSGPEDIEVESNINFAKSSEARQEGKTDKINLGKLKPTDKGDQSPGTSQTTENVSVNSKDSNANNDGVDISEKINHIRKRRKLKEAKATVDIKRPKVQKKERKTALSEFQELIPEGLQADEEVNLLSQIAKQSSLKVDEINKNLQNQLNNLTSKLVQIPIPSSSHIIPQATSVARRPISRPTRIPRKEVIPQIEKEKTAVLRNKLKAIEVFRKGKHGPGYVPKKERKKILPKAAAELSESSDE